MSRAARDTALIIGGRPRVELLPPEVIRARAAKVIRRRLALGVVVVLAIVVAATGIVTAGALQAEQQLALEQAHTDELLAQEAEFTEVRSVQRQVELVEAAQQVGVSTEIDWKEYLDQVQATLPSSVKIITVTVDSASPLALYTQATAPLQGARVATVSFTAESALLPDVPAWLNGLATLPGYADALPGSVHLDETTRLYTANITMHVNDAAFARRFVAEGK
jgi:Tfp pilus assembly protein PilN